MVKSRRNLLQRICTTVVGSLFLSSSRSDEESDRVQPDMQNSTEPERIPRGIPTLGGRQFWGDVAFRAGFRIQRNVFTGHHRLLDRRDFRLQWGTLESCQSTLTRICREQKIPEQTGRIVILLHGIGRSSHSLSPVQVYLEERGFKCCPFDYPSTRVSLADCAGYLRAVIESVPEVTQIGFVCHSMGGLVVRQLLSDFADERMQHLIMLGTPNKGAEMAAMLRDLSLFRLIYGPAGAELAGGLGSVVEQLPIPEFPFGVIAGGRGDGEGFNRLLEGDDDGTVTVASTQLPGAADFLLIPRLHSFLMSSPEALAAIDSFLRVARFRAEETGDED